MDREPLWGSCSLHTTFREFGSPSYYELRERIHARVAGTPNLWWRGLWFSFTRRLPYLRSHFPPDRTQATSFPDGFIGLTVLSCAWFGLSQSRKKRHIAAHVHGKLRPQMIENANFINDIQLFLLTHCLNQGNFINGKGVIMYKGVIGEA